jgi:hypothetical protein
VQPPSDPPERASDTGTNGGREAVQRWRLVLRRQAVPAEQTQREQLAEWETLLVASGLPVAGLDAPRAKARLVFAAPLSSGISGEAELIDLWLVERLPRWRVREALAAGLPAGHALVDLYNVWLGEPPLPGRVVASVYRAHVSPPVEPSRVAAAAEALLAADTLPRVRRKGEASVSYDLRPFLASIEITPEPEGTVMLRMTLRHDPARGVGRPDETLAALGELLGGAPLQPQVLVRERLVLTELPLPVPPAPRGPGRQPAPRSSVDARPRGPGLGDRSRQGDTRQGDTRQGGR